MGQQLFHQGLIGAPIAGVAPYVQHQRVSVAPPCNYSVCPNRAPQTHELFHQHRMCRSPRPLKLTCDVAHACDV
eukprot:6618218-Pyramimonas_sp.AAC.1